jgi:putative ABC transport system permease protein
LLVVSGAALTIIPALHFSRRDLQSALSSGARGTDSRGLHRLRGGLASFEVALALLLTIGAGLMIKSFWRLRGSDPGFRPDHLLTLRFDVPNGKYSGTTRLALGDEIAERVKQLPGVADAAVTMVDPFVWPGLNRGFTIENHTNVMNPESVYYEEITPGYFRTMSIPLLAGRDFTPSDDEKSPVVIVSQSFARRYWPGQDAIGKRLKIGKNTQPWLSVIGVVADAQIDDLHQSKSDLALFYSPLRRSEAIISLSVLVRTKVDPASLIAPIRNELQRFDPDMPVYSVATLEERLAGEAAGARSYAVLMSLFGAISLSLAVIGTYGVIAFAAAQRTREIGIRIALGAQATDILRMMTAHGLRIALVGLGIGIIAAFALTRFLATLLFGVSPHDPLIFAGIALLLVFACVAASLIPARAATRVDPAVALRYE